MTNNQPSAVTEEMVTRFLKYMPPEGATKPTGTNLFTENQARQMLEHVLGGEVAPKTVPLRAEFYTCFGEVDGRRVALPEYGRATVHEVEVAVLNVARGEGYLGTIESRLTELGWQICPVFSKPQPEPVVAMELMRNTLKFAKAWLAQARHGEECRLISRGHGFDDCMCGKDYLLSCIDTALATTQPEASLKATP